VNTTEFETVEAMLLLAREQIEAGNALLNRANALMGRNAGEQPAKTLVTPKAPAPVTGLTVPVITPDMNDNRILSAWMRANGLDINGRWAEAKVLVPTMTSEDGTVLYPQIVTALLLGTVTVPPKAKAAPKVKAKAAKPVKGGPKPLRAFACEVCGTTATTKNDRQRRCHDCSVQASTDFQVKVGIVK
jgi:hypothetical protein